METMNHFDPMLVYTLHGRIVVNPYIIITKLKQYFNKFFYLLHNSNGAYVEIFKNNYYIQKTELLSKDLGRYTMNLV